MCSCVTFYFCSVFQKLTSTPSVPLRIAATRPRAYTFACIRIRVPRCLSWSVSFFGSTVQHRHRLEVTGRILFRLFDDVVPRMAQHFREFMTGKYSFGYAGSSFYRIIPNVCIKFNVRLRSTPNRIYHNSSCRKAAILCCIIGLERSIPGETIRRLVLRGTPQFSLAPAVDVSLSCRMTKTDAEFYAFCKMRSLCRSTTDLVFFLWPTRALTRTDPRYVYFHEKICIGSEREACGFTEGRVESVDTSSSRRKSLNGSTACTWSLAK